MLRFGSAWRISLVSILIQRATYITNGSEIMISARLQKSPQCVGKARQRHRSLLTLYPLHLCGWLKRA